ncbi:hypothetical protein ANCCAN_03330 [Ancylostoma caninum]|uniref:Uncharacterized protein n=1 Tax=Ancylostoma caninum TaxID=29170 RepID=A0A368H1I4_ANCCA|nr:hypothetical protein ANCCAN_03330 [Ancylostoma caninum]
MINRKFEDASMKDVDSDSLKCLVFLSSPTNPSHSETRLQLLNQLNRLKESDPAPLLDEFINECETFVTLRTDNRAIQSKEVNAAYERKPAKETYKHPYSLNKGFRYRRQPRDYSLHSPSRKERKALHKFLQTYCRTPCSASPGGRSPAGNFLGRQLRTPLTMLTMPKSAVKERNRKTERQFNLHNNARPKKLGPDDRVWVRNFGRGETRWTPGRVLARHGHAAYDVLTERRVHGRHSNQMRPNASENTEKTLMDLFDLPILPVQTSPNKAPASTYTHAQATTLRRPDSSEPDEDAADMSAATADADATTLPTPTPLR